MIVKIQRSQPPTPPGKILVYSRTGEFWEGEPDSALEAWIGSRQKVFAHAHIEGSEFVIDRSAPWQNW